MEEFEAARAARQEVRSRLSTRGDRTAHEEGRGVGWGVGLGCAAKLSASVARGPGAEF